MNLFPVRLGCILKSMQEWLSLERMFIAFFSLTNLLFRLF